MPTIAPEITRGDTLSPVQVAGTTPPSGFGSTRCCALNCEIAVPSTWSHDALEWVAQRKGTLMRPERIS